MKTFEVQFNNDQVTAIEASGVRFEGSWVIFYQTYGSNPPFSKKMVVAYQASNIYSVEQK